ncbi:Nucleic acid-binding OB-fold [Penicillium chermesinum]|nr:Nucleic acid-binding OB-fold [Penicillium chermesinum]
MSANLDFDARVPIPFSVFPSSYRSDAVSETTQTRVEGEVQLDRTSHVEREDTQAPLPDPRVFGKEEVDIRIQDRQYSGPAAAAPPAPVYTQQTYNQQAYNQPAYPQPYTAEVDLTRERPLLATSNNPKFTTSLLLRPSSTSLREITVAGPLPLTTSTSPDDRRYQQPVDRSQPPAPVADFSYDRAYPSQPSAPYKGEAYTRSQVDVSRTSCAAPAEPKAPSASSKTTTVRDTAPTRKMGYYDDEGQYHSFRRGVQRAADHLLHPFHDRHEEVVIDKQRSSAPAPVVENIRIIEPRNRGTPGETVAIPCHFIRIGDILILQGRPCQVIRISVSSQTGQHRYLGVDLFTRQLQEESSFVSNPSPSVVVQTMLGPVYKTYRILDVNVDSTITAMTETGDVKQGLPVISQNSLFTRISESFADGRGSVRALVINDGGRELVVDYKVIHGSRL